MAQLVRASPCHGEGREFESLLGRYGVLAQLGEHLPYKQRVIGSSPIVPTIILGPVVQLVRTLACHARGREFEPHPGRHSADLAHLVERHLAKVEVASSSLVIRSITGAIAKW